MIRVSAFRFFLAVLPAPIWMRAAFAIAVVFSLATLWLDPREVDAALGTVLLLQMFAVSNGYTAFASRGYFDPLLLNGQSWARLAFMNLCAAAVPGAVAWLVIVLGASCVGQASTALAPHRHAAFVLVSCTAWALGRALPRLAGGALWSLVLVGLAMSKGSIAHYLQAAQSGPLSLIHVGRSAAAGALCPFLFLGDFPGMTDSRVVATAVAMAAAITTAGTLFIARRDYRLEERA
jgi:uncharacterized membrane protein YecN with MAPEG domain